jgi:uncharacterized DUF497 family protein
MWCVLWNGNVAHIEEHGLTVEDVEYVLARPQRPARGAATGLPCVFGRTSDGRYIIVVYEQIDADTIYPVTAYEVPEPRGT